MTRILSTADIHFPTQPEAPALPELPDFLTSLGNDPFAGHPAMLGTQPPVLTPAPAPGEDPYAGMELSRNALCPCGSGRKYKHCHGAVA